MQDHSILPPEERETLSQASPPIDIAVEQDNTDHQEFKSLAETSVTHIDHPELANQGATLSWFCRAKMNISPIKDLILSFVAALAFSALLDLFIYSVLLKGRVQVGTIFFDASTTNYLISICSQFSVILFDLAIRSLLGAIRLALAARNGGVPASTFFGISPASEWLSVLRFALVHRLLDIWCDFRLWIPILGLAKGSVLKFQASFAYHFVTGKIQMPIFAGLLPLDNRVLQIIPIADLTLYFLSYTASLTSNSKFAVKWDMDGCEGACRSILLPAGIEGTRQHGPFQNISIFEGGVLNNAETLRVENATGILTKFEALGSDLTFDPLEECLYSGQMIDDALQICIRQVDRSIVVSWEACPQVVFDANTCSTNLTWTSGPRKWATKMTAYRQPTTTAYDRQNFSIVDVQPTFESEIMFLNATEYFEVFNKILIPTNSSTAVDLNGMNALIYYWTWLHRTYNEIYHDDKISLMTNLHNILVIPLQFTMTAVQFANYTVPRLGLEEKLGKFALPDRMNTTVSSGWSRSKLAIQTWTGWLFIATDIVICILILIGILWILVQSKPLPTPTGIGELDILNSAARMTCNTQQRPASESPEDSENARNEKKTMTLGQFAHQTALLEKSSLLGFGTAAALRDTTISLDQASGAETEEL